MTILEIILALFSFTTFSLAIYAFVDKKIRRKAEEANTMLYIEKLKHIQSSLEAALHSTDAIVQIPKHRESGIEELQNLARISRGQIYKIVQYLDDNQKLLDNWQYGRMIKSLPNKKIKRNSDDLQQGD